MDRSDASSGLAFLVNGAKETRTPDPLHAIQQVRCSESPEKIVKLPCPRTEQRTANTLNGMTQVAKVVTNGGVL